MPSLAHTPEQQWLPERHAPRSGLHAVSQRPFMHRWLQQSTAVVQVAPGSAQIARAQRESKPQVLPAQHHEVLRQKPPTPAQATWRQIPAEQLRLQHSLSAAQVAPSRPQVVAVRHTPLEHISPSQHPAPQGCPSREQVIGAWHVPLLHERPAQQPAPQGCPRSAQVVGVWQVPLTHERPAQQPVPQGWPAALQVVAAWQVPAVQREPVQHSPSNTQRLPSARHAHVPPEQSM